MVLKFSCVHESTKASFKNQIPGSLPSEFRRPREPRNLHLNKLPCLIFIQGTRDHSSRKTDKKMLLFSNFMPASMIGPGETRIINSNAGYHYLNDNHIPTTLLNVLYLLMLNLSQQPPSQIILLPPCYRWVNRKPHRWSNLPQTSIAQSLTDDKHRNWDVNAGL